MSGARRRFRFIKEIAEGGFGKVYLAEQLSADGFSRIVAIKLLHAKWTTHDEVVMRTRDEARLLGLIRHQHIVRVEDLTSIDGKCAIVMEYLEGVDLKIMMTHLQETGVEFPRTALFEIMIAVCSALDAAYNRVPLQGKQTPLRVIHRDIKPSNVFVTVNGAIKVLDFGTARADFAEREAKTQALAFGSQGYMAPERMLGEEDTPAADVFSLGISLYELLSLESFGRIPPRPNKFAAKVDDRIAGVPLTGDTEWCDQVRETLRLMMSYEPTDRPTAKQLVDIFEILAQNANDMPFRRFCRTLVAESKSNLPELETGDPLTGGVVDEDVSSSWSKDEAGVPAIPVSPQATATPPPVPMGLGPSAAPSASTTTPAPVASRSGQPVAAPPDATSAPIHGSDLDEPGEAGGAGKMMMLAAGAAVVLVLLVGAAAVVAGGAFYASQGGAPAGIQPEPAPVVEAAPAVDLPDGGVITTPDERTDVGRAKSVQLKMQPNDGAKVKISGTKLKAEWDGRSAFDMGTLAEGTYRATVTPVGGSKIRNKSFKIVSDKVCEFTFEVASEAWKGGCE